MLMGNFKWEGWQTAADDPPQPTSILFGKNLKAPLLELSGKTEDEQPPREPSMPPEEAEILRELSNVVLPMDSSEPDFVISLLKKGGLPLTRENYLGLAYPEGVPEDLDESSLPPEIRQA
jgi:hypothetical protein